MVFRLSKSKSPCIVHDIPVPMIIRPGGTSTPEYKEKTYHIVLSIDVGNTTTDCIITGTNLETGITYLVNRNVQLMKDLSGHTHDDEIIAKTLDGIEISQKATWKGSAHSELRKAQHIVYFKWSIPAQDIVD